MSKKKLLLFLSLLLAVLVGLLAFREGYHRGLSQCSQCHVNLHPHHFGAEFLTTFPNGVKFIGQFSAIMERELLRDGYYEPGTVAVLQKSAQYLKGKMSSATYVDIGANVGMSLLPVAPLVDKVIAVEPYPPVLIRLKKNVEINNFDHVAIVEKGLGNSRGRVKFALPPDWHSGVGSFSKDVFDHNSYLRDLHHESLEKSETYFDIVPGDELLDGQSVELLKIDVEGYERYVLEGMQKLLKTSRPIVIMELNRNADGGFTTEAELKNLFPAGSSFYQIGDPQSSACLSSFVFQENDFRQVQLFIVSSDHKELADNLMSQNCDSLS